MASVQLLGMTHYPPFGWRDEDMAGLMRNFILPDPGIPDDAKDPANWPEPMQAEWGDDGARATAAAHRQALIDGFDRVRAELEAFQPDAILVWGDDQYENFKEDVIPPYALLAYDDMDVQPHAGPTGKMFPNVWGEPDDYTVTVKGRPDIARWLATRLLSDGIDVAYAYKPLHYSGFAHAFMNTVLFLDHDRVGFPWPIVCMPINCYGSKVISATGGLKPFGKEGPADPPSPSPSRLMDVGASVARSLIESPWRIAIVASSSWSHAFLTDHTWRLRPDTDADRTLYDALVAGDYGTWEKATTEQIERAGQQEVLNWFALAGAAREIGATPIWSKFDETWCFNSNKVFAVWDPVS